jgi:hypothetical protein
MMTAPPYTLTLRRQDRILLVVGITFFTAGGVAIVATSIRDTPPPLVLLFFLVWTAIAVWMFWQSLRGPTQIQVLPGGQVRIRDWFNQERRVAMIEIEEIGLQGNLLTIKTTDRKYVGLSGFDGLHRFVHDVAEHNSSLVTKGI